MNNCDDFKFGIEIEFVLALLDEIKKRFKDYEEIGSKWLVEFEHLVSCIDDNHKVVGGEVISPILTISEYHYNNIRRVLNEMKKSGAGTNGETGFHVHIDANYLGDNLDYLKLLELWLAYENIIYQYGFNEIYRGRLALLYFAKPLNFKREGYLKIIDILKYYNASFFTARDYLDEDIFEDYFTKEYGLNFRNIIHSDIDDGKFDNKKTVEFRCCDGSLDEKFIINTVEIFKKIVDISKSNNLDIDYLRYRNNRKINDLSIREFAECDNRDLEEFLKLVNFGNEQEEYFIKQYYKR